MLFKLNSRKMKVSEISRPRRDCLLARNAMSLSNNLKRETKKKEKKTRGNNS